MTTGVNLLTRASFIYVSAGKNSVRSMILSVREKYESMGKVRFEYRKSRDWVWNWVWGK